MVSFPSRQKASLIAALVLGAAIRIPGVFWGWNFPPGWAGHHIDEFTHQIYAEMLIEPTRPPRWSPNPYPRGLAAHVALPFLAVRAVQGQLRGELPPVVQIITAGRVVGWLYGTATIAIVFLLARRLFTDSRVAHLAAWLFALAGLHVTQSHFFVADVPALFWSLVGTLLLLREMLRRDASGHAWLSAAAFSFGVAFGLKLVVATLPSLAIVALWRPARMERAIMAAAFFLCGLVIVNAGTYTTPELLMTMLKSASSWEFSRVFSMLVYAIQGPSLAGGAVLLLGMAAVIPMARRLFAKPWTADRTAVVLCVILPQVILAGLVVFTMDNFLRHAIPFIPWLVLAAAWTLVSLIDLARRRGLHPAWILAPVFAYQLAFVVDGERFFIDEPRNHAAQWLRQNVPSQTEVWWDGHQLIWDYKDVVFPRDGRPEVLVIEMHRANEYLSGMGWKNNLPRERRFVFGPRSQRTVDQLQAVFEGRSEYREVARFEPDYVMPEYRIVETLLGNRSRNYLAEVVIFKKAPRTSSQHRE